MTMRGVVALGVALVALVGCQGAEPGRGVTPAVSGTSVATPSPLASSSPSVSASQSKQELVAEAEGRFREYFALQLKLEAAGGTTTLDPVIDSYIAEPYRGSLLESLSQMKQADVHVEETNLARVKSVSPIDERGLEDAVVALRICLDGTKSVVVAPDGTKSAGIFVQSDYWFKRDAFGVLRIFYGVAESGKPC